jgi:hypothetical protein
MGAITLAMLADTVALFSSNWFPYVYAGGLFAVVLILAIAAGRYFGDN